MIKFDKDPERQKRSEKIEIVSPKSSLLGKLQLSGSRWVLNLGWDNLTTL